MLHYCCDAAEHQLSIRCTDVASLDLPTLAMVVAGLVLQAAEPHLATTEEILKWPSSIFA